MNNAPMTTAEVAVAAGRSVKTITRWVASGRLVPVKVLPGYRGGFLFDPRDVKALVTPERKAS